jgi:hypothetical protein
MKKVCVTLMGIMICASAYAFPLIGYCKPDKGIKVQYKVEKPDKDGKSEIAFNNFSDCTAKIKIVYKSNLGHNVAATTFVKPKDKNVAVIPIKDKAPDKNIVSIEIDSKTCN